MIVLVIALTVGWVILNVAGALADDRFAAIYWAVLSIGTTFLVLVLVGVVLYLSLSIKAINLNRRQSNFIDAVTHELKSPIASLKLCLQTLARRQLPPEEQANFHRFMLEDVERLDQLINHVLDAARLEHVPPERLTEAIDLAALLRETVRLVCAQHRIAEDIVRWELNPVRVNSVRADLDLIFRNLIDNAVKYAGTPPRVAVRLGIDSEGWAVVTVQDNGPGIPRKYRRRIFRRFVRLGSELERAQPGMGLGLYIVRELTRRLKGRIRVDGADPHLLDESAGGACGTTFEVRLPHATPLVTDTPATLATAAAECQPAGRGL